GGMPGAKRCKGLGERTMGAQREALRRLGEERALEGYDGAKRDLLRRERRDIAHLLRREQSVGDQHVRADQTLLVNSLGHRSCPRLLRDRASVAQSVPGDVLCHRWPSSGASPPPGPDSLRWH